MVPGVTLQDYAVTLTANGVAFANTTWPETITDIHGSFAVAPGKIVASDLSGKSGPLTLTGNATYFIDTGACDLNALITSDHLLGGWMTKLPPGVGNFFSDQKTGGTLTLTLSKMTRAGFDAPWKFASDVAADKFTMGGVVAMDADRLRLASSGTIANGAVDFTGDFSGTNVTLAGKTFDTLGASVALTREDHSLHVTDIDGKVAGGSVQGTIVVMPGVGVEPATAGRYEANLSMKDADLAGLLLPRGASAEERAKVGRGKVSATLSVQQAFGEYGDRTGRGELLVQDGKIYNVPLAMGLMQVVTLRLPVARSFDRAAMSYFLRDNKVTFEKILLESSSINLAGSGTMSLHDKALDLNFVTESPNAFHLPLISPIITQIRDELLQLAVTGTIDNPKVTPVPLSAALRAASALLPHHQQANNQ